MPPLSEAGARRFLAERHQGVLATISRRDGRPHLTNVAYAFRDGAVRISTTTDRVKTANLRADDRAALQVHGDDHWTYVVAEGRAEISDVATEPGDEVGRALLDLYNEIAEQPHDDPEEFGEAMVAERRVLVSLSVDRLYPLTQA